MFPGEKLAYLFKSKAIWDNGSSSKEQADLKEKSANPVLSVSKSAREQREPAAPYRFENRAQEQACKGKGAHQHQPGPVPQCTGKEAWQAQERQLHGDKAGLRSSQEVNVMIRESMCRSIARPSCHTAKTRYPYAVAQAQTGYPALCLNGASGLLGRGVRGAGGGLRRGCSGAARVLGA